MKQRRPLTTEEAAALAKVARRYGRTWKQHIRAIWLEASPRDDEESILYALRNSHGPAWLTGYDAQPAPARVPCECGSTDATWHGDTARIYCCDRCWPTHPNRCDQPALPGAETVRETENATPAYDAPYSLTPQASDRRAHQKGLF